VKNVIDADHVYRVVKNNVVNRCDNLRQNLTALGLDVAGAFVPFVTGLGTVYRAGQAAKMGDELVDLYRFVGPEEFYDIAARGRFSSGEGMMEAKQFERNFDEVLRLADHFTDASAIVRVTVPSSTLRHLDLTPVDRHILTSGTVTARGQEQLNVLNRSFIGDIQHVF
jgi:hypothetical protein